MSKRSRRNSGGFSLLELVIVVTIIGIIAAIAIPRMSRGSAGAASSALKGDLAVLRNGIDLYATEHGGTFPTVGSFEAQMTTYTSAAGATNATKTTTYIYGPYVRSIPKLPVGAKTGENGVAAADGSGVGWIYTVATGAFKANCTDSEVDDAGEKYNEY